MIDSQNEIEALLRSVDGSINELDDLEQSYKQQKEQITTELASYTRQLAERSDSLAIRGKVIRELYWNKRLSATLISEAFGLKVGAMKRIAGSLVLEAACSRGCGNSVKKTYKSRSELEDDLRSARRRAKHAARYPEYAHLSSGDVCDDCRKREKAKWEAEAARKEKAGRERNEELRAMSWQDYIETEEWIETRDYLIHEAGYGCEICHARGISLYVFLHKDTPQDYPVVYSKGYNYFVLCNGCVARCDDLINKEKGEFINREFMPEIMERNQERNYN